MKTCSNCFASMDAFAAACPSCGYQAQTNAFTPFEEPKRFRLPRISVKVVAIAAAAIVAVAGAGFVATNLPFNRGIKFDEGLVPILVGYPAIEAFAAAEEIGFDVHAETEAREYILGSGEELQAKLIGQFVCYQSQLAGTSIVPNADLALVIGATCEGREPSMLAGKYAADAEVWSPATPNQPNALDNAELEGWIVGYGDKYSPQNVTLLTTFGEVGLKLAMIEPIDNWCRADAYPDVDLNAKALAERDTLLAFGTPVRAVLAAGPGNNATFMHRLGANGVELDGAAPANSANELLIKSGYWIPDIFGVDESEEKVDPLKRVWASTSSDTFTEVEQKYIELLVAAANATRLETGNPMFVCVAADKTYWDAVLAPYYKQLAEAEAEVVANSNLNVGKCWVSPYIRRGRWVSGYWRNC
jgi:hypothetical protein